MKKINILVVQQDTVGGVGFYRSFQPHKHLEKLFPDEFNIEYCTEPQWGNLPWFDKFDIIHIHRGLYQNMIEFIQALRYFKAHNIVTIMDIDDHWKIDPRHPLYFQQKAYHLDEIIKSTFKEYDYITTTTKYFAEALKPFNTNIKIIPNAIDPEDERFIVKKNPSNKLRIGMVMGSSHEYDMQLIGKISNQLSKEELDKVQFVLCGFDTRGSMRIIDSTTGEMTERPIQPTESVWYRYEQMMTSDYSIVSPEYKNFLLNFFKDLEYPNVENEHYRRCWTKDIDHYYQHYANIDVLLAPLEVKDFNKVKSQLKVIECAFSHTALIASDFGPYTIDLTSAIERGGNINKQGNALLVDENKNHKNWLKYIKKLIKDPELVKMLQDNLYNDIKDKYNLTIVTKDRADFYKNILLKKE